MYKAERADRYLRQAKIKEIGEKTGAQLLCYVSGRYAEIGRDDTIGFIDLLHNVRRGEPIDLFMHTRGGDLDAAEKLTELVQTAVGTARFRVIIPDMAKSAGTLMALGADAIVMSDSSELGAIDPQIALDDGRGNHIVHSVLNFLDAYAEHSDALRKNPEDPVARIMLEQIHPGTLSTFEAIRDRARNLAQDLLKAKGKNFTAIASALMDRTRWPSHGQMIKWGDAQQIGLTVEYLRQTDALWQEYWELYCLLRLAVKDNEKIFESSYASLILDS
jgi:ClpP class serine protease